MISIDGGITWAVAAKTPNKDINYSDLSFGSNFWVAIATNCNTCSDQIRIIRIAENNITT